MPLTQTRAQVLAQLLDTLDPDGLVVVDTAAMLRRTLRTLPAVGGSSGLARALRDDLAAVADELELLGAL